MEKTFGELLTHWMDVKGLGATDLAKLATQKMSNSGRTISNSYIGKILRGYTHPNARDAIRLPHPRSKRALIDALDLDDVEFYKDAPRFRSNSASDMDTSECDLRTLLNKPNVRFGGVLLSAHQKELLLRIAESWGFAP